MQTAPAPSGAICFEAGRFVSLATGRRGFKTDRTNSAGIETDHAHRSSKERGLAVAVVQAGSPFRVQAV